MEPTIRCSGDFGWSNHDNLPPPNQTPINLKNDPHSRGSSFVV